MPKTEFAAAKINLTLEILGRRGDGYHELRSLVVFARDAGDRLSLEPGPNAKTEIEGTFAAGIGDTNLVDRAVAAVSALMPNNTFGRLALEKNLPVASGIGGGSADAAAALRLLASEYPDVESLDLPVVARSLGADVPVCLRSRSAIMGGTGENIDAVALPGDLFAVLANPQVAVPANKTAQVFRQLGAKPFPAGIAKEAPPAFSSIADVIAYASARGNALEVPSRQLFPEVGEVLAELGKLPGCRLSRLSGAGPTCFALFETQAAASKAAERLKVSKPRWWIAATRLM